jgi:hypothetical protein
LSEKSGAVRIRARARKLRRLGAGQDGSQPHKLGYCSCQNTSAQTRPAPATECGFVPFVKKPRDCRRVGRSRCGRAPVAAAHCAPVESGCSPSRAPSDRARRGINRPLGPESGARDVGLAGEPARSYLVSADRLAGCRGDMSRRNAGVHGEMAFRRRYGPIRQTVIIVSSGSM